MRILLPFLFIFSVAKGQETQLFYLPDSVTIEFVKIPGGTFLMGSPFDETGRDKDEAPQHEVSIKEFWLGTYEVTQTQWLCVMGYNPSTFKQKIDHLSYPVETVSWSETQAFIDKLNQLGIGSFRLPTEEEWEYACRAGSQTAYYWGEYKNEWMLNQYAWMNSRSMATSHVVGKKPPNDWGLYDMSGNVWEWTSTAYHPYGEATQNDNLKVFRGGSWFDFGKSQRSANRHKHRIDEKFSTIGLRLVWEYE
ncbi:MAG: formylglycine-generating enzyme family protein [Bacteroidota bacterium]